LSLNQLTFLFANKKKLQKAKRFELVDFFFNYEISKLFSFLQPAKINKKKLIYFFLLKHISDRNEEKEK
jgi:hypothetical protein